MRWQALVIVVGACGGSDVPADAQRIETFDVTITGHGHVDLGSASVACALDSCTGTLAFDQSTVPVGTRAIVEASTTDAGYIPGVLSAGSATADGIDGGDLLVLDEPEAGTAIAARFDALPACPDATVDVGATPAITSAGMFLDFGIVPAVCAGKVVSLSGHGLVDPASTTEGSPHACAYFGTTPATFFAWTTVSGETPPLQNVSISVPASTPLGDLEVVDQDHNGRAIAIVPVVSGPAPTIASIAPATGATGATITITGTGLDLPGFATLASTHLITGAPLSATSATSATFTVPSVPADTYSIGVEAVCGQTAVTTGPMLEIK